MYIMHRILAVLIDPELDILAGIAALVLWASKL